MITTNPEPAVLAVPPSAPRGLFEWIDSLSGSLLVFILAAAPWLFGATEPWSVWLLNGAGYFCGILLASKWLVRWSTGALAVRRIFTGRGHAEVASRWLVRALAVLTIGVLFFTLVAALNARATFLPREQRFEYHDYIQWLPFTYDSTLTWMAFWNFLALACYFWALRDWLVHPARPRDLDEVLPISLPPRFERILWVIALNATLLALAGIFQRLDGTSKLLWMRPNYDGRPESMFASFTYNGNAAQYLNLCWPVMLGFWWILRQSARQRVWRWSKVGSRPHISLLPCVIVTAAGALVTYSLGGAIVTVVCLAFTTLVFLLDRRGTWRTRSAVFLVSISILALAGGIGWPELGPALRDLFKTPYANPNELAANARVIAGQYHVFGIGPGAFRAIYHLYRSDPAQPWQAFLHDDWFETRVTFGWVGALLILSLLGLVLARWFLGDGVPCSWEFAAMAWVALWGCLAHAKFSFPLQIYSVLVLFLTVCCLLSCVGRSE